MSILFMMPIGLVGDLEVSCVEFEAGGGEAGVSEHAKRWHFAPQCTFLHRFPSIMRAKD
jgi:hypothetical protein